jgi:hypothetical protein
VASGVIRSWYRTRAVRDEARDLRLYHAA